ncbi:MAG: thermonuclease family protein [Deltaproteobacteria bacterium]|nr:thermonuclease family protein [Deltaproteobacteria bacterium]
MLLAVVAAAVVGCPAANDLNTTASPCGPADGLVVNVVDGDTVDLATGVRIRYLLVDTPEVPHSTAPDSCCFGPEAKELNTSLVLNQAVKLEYDQECQDHFGRTLAYVSLDERMVNEILLERGYARLEVIPPNEKHAADFEAIQAAAKAADAGLWGACSTAACPLGAFK